jgi:hypothetical protein
MPQGNNTSRFHLIPEYEHPVALQLSPLITVLPNQESVSWVTGSTPELKQCAVIGFIRSSLTSLYPLELVTTSMLPAFPALNDCNRSVVYLVGSVWACGNRSQREACSVSSCFAFGERFEERLFES